MKRLQEEYIVRDLEKKIVFIVGPRQVGKTWLAKKIGAGFKRTVYLNYDRFEDREIIKNEGWVAAAELLILDELHKMDGWKNYLKGVYDTKPDHLRIMVTGSARLDTFRQVGDSLAGRFFVHRLLPFSPFETSQINENFSLDRFVVRGGFPEPFLAESDIEAKRWRKLYSDGLVRDDVLDFEKIHDFKAIKMVFELLRRRVGSPVSYSSIARDVGISPATVIKYIQIFEALYVIFRVSPFSKNIARSILKEPKIYFFDNGMVVGDDGARLENFVAVAFLKHLLMKNDLEGEDYELKYLRNKEGKEVDFCLVNEDEIERVFEVKLSDAKIHRNLKYFCEKYNLAGVQLVKELKREYATGKIEVRNCAGFLEDMK